jgi:hypothetical protein
VIVEAPIPARLPLFSAAPLRFRPAPFSHFRKWPAFCCGGFALRPRCATAPAGWGLFAGAVFHLEVPTRESGGHPDQHGEASAIFRCLSITFSRALGRLHHR